MGKQNNIVEYLASLTPKQPLLPTKSNIMGIASIKDYFSILADIEKTKRGKK